MASNSSNGYTYCPTNFIDQDSPSDLAVWGWRNYENDIMGLQPIGRIVSNNYSRDAASVRQKTKLEQNRLLKNNTHFKQNVE